MQIFFSLLVLNVMDDLNLFLKNENYFGMQLFKSGNHVRKWRDFYAPTVRSWRPEFGPEGKHFVSVNSLFFSFWGAAKLLLARGAQRLVWRVNEPKKTAMRSARARISGQTPLVVSERLLLRYEQIILLRHFNSLRGIPFRSELRNWLFRGTRNASE